MTTICVAIKSYRKTICLLRPFTKAYGLPGDKIIEDSKSKILNGRRQANRNQRLKDSDDKLLRFLLPMN